jgi:hypothetical protein
MVCAYIYELFLGILVYFSKKKKTLAGKRLVFFMYVDTT